MIRFFLCIAAILSTAATAQQTITYPQAAEINSRLALQFCLNPQLQGPQKAQMFRNAGFSERVDRSNVNSDTTHYFTAPSGTAQAEVYYGEMAPHCFVSSQYMGVTTASSVLDQVVPMFFPRFTRKVDYGPMNPATGQPTACVRYEDPTNPIGLVIGASPGSNANGCIDNGTSAFYATYRV